MSTRRYRHHCGLAHSLNLVGERWALLVVRELLSGPARYTDLLDGLPGVGTNQLANRLKELEEAGLVQRRALPPPAASTVYELTEDGRDLEVAVLALTRFGTRRLTPGVQPDQVFRPRWAALALRARGAGEVCPGTHEARYEVRVEDEVWHEVVGDGQVHTGAGPLAGADLTVVTDGMTAYELATGRLTLGAALESGAVRTTGPSEAVRQWAALHALSV